MRATDPKGALAMLEETRRKVEMTSGLEPAIRDQFLRSVDRAIAETKQVIAQNRPQIELNEKNNRIRQDVERQQRVKVEVQAKIAMKIDQFNRLMEEQRYAEAVVSRQAGRRARPQRAGRDAGAGRSEADSELPRGQGHSGGEGRTASSEP